MPLCSEATTRRWCKELLSLKLARRFGVTQLLPRLRPRDASRSQPQHTQVEVACAVEASCCRRGLVEALSGQKRPESTAHPGQRRSTVHTPGARRTTGRVPTGGPALRRRAPPPPLPPHPPPGPCSRTRPSPVNDAGTPHVLEEWRGATTGAPHQLSVQPPSG